MLVTVQKGNGRQEVDVSIEEVLADLASRVADGTSWREQLSVIDYTSRVLEKIDPAVLDRLKTKPEAVRMLRERLRVWVAFLSSDESRQTQPPAVAPVDESSLQARGGCGRLDHGPATDIGPQRAAPSSPAKVQAEATAARKILSEVQHGG